MEEVMMGQKANAEKLAVENMQLPARQVRAGLPANINQVKAEVTAWIESGLLPPHIRTWQQGFLIAKRGEELGMTPLQALSSLYIVKNKVSCDTKSMLALAYASNLIESFEVSQSATSATCTIKRRGQKRHSETFTLDDARNLGLIKQGGTYETQPATMLKWRAITACLRVTVPDAIEGMYTHDEMGLPVKVEIDENLVLDETRVELEVGRQELMSDIGDAFDHGAVAPARAEAESASPTTQPTPPVCAKCGKLMALRTAKTGKSAGSQFWGCTAYPDCKNTHPYHQPVDAQTDVEVAEIKEIALQLYPEWKDLTPDTLKRKAAGLIRSVLNMGEKQKVDLKDGDTRQAALTQLRRVLADKQEAEQPPF